MYISAMLEVCPGSQRQEFVPEKSAQICTFTSAKALDSNKLQCQENVSLPFGANLCCQDLHDLATSKSCTRLLAEKSAHVKKCRLFSSLQACRQQRPFKYREYGQSKLNARPADVALQNAQVPALRCSHDNNCMLGQQAMYYYSEMRASSAKCYRK